MSEVCTAIILKAANYLSIAKRQEVNLNLRKLKEKVEYLEEKAVDDKKEFGAVKARLEE